MMAATRHETGAGARTKTELSMLQRLSTLEKDGPRYRVLVNALGFKRSWLELAEDLTEVQRSGSFKEWGYRTFEAYVQHELHLRRDTAMKLTRSFDFLESHEPKLLKGAKREDVALPTFQALDVLAAARANPALSSRDYGTIRDQVFSGPDMTEAQVKKLVREVAPPPEKPKRDPEEGVRKCLQLAERLYGLVMEEDAPDSVTRGVEEAVCGLRRMLDQ